MGGIMGGTSQSPPPHTVDAHKSTLKILYSMEFYFIGKIIFTSVSLDFLSLTCFKLCYIHI